MKYLLYTLLLSCTVVGLTPHPGHASERPIILELYTSHGCSSCPEADRIVKEFSDLLPNLMPLSFHVTYWDYLGFKDPYALEEATKRQRNYAQLHGSRNVFTPQVMVEGMYSAVGNNHEDVNKAIRLAENAVANVPIDITKDRYDLHITVNAKPHGEISIPSGAAVWLIYYKKYSMTAVDGGENSGKTIENINNVIKIERMGFWHNDAITYHIPRNRLIGDGLVVILQSSPQNQILGAAVYHDYAS
jgi:hypothetical protein